MRMTILALAAALFPASAFAESVSVPLYDGPPASGQLTHDHVVFFRAKKGECPPTHKGRQVEWFNIVIGGNDHQGSSRETRRCVIIDSSPLKSAGSNWEKQPERNASRNESQPVRKASSTAPATLDSEPGPGKLNAGDVVYVKFSEKLQCPRGDLIRVTGALNKDGRRERICVSSASVR